MLVMNRFAWNNRKINHPDSWYELLVKVEKRQELDLHFGFFLFCDHFNCQARLKQKVETFKMVAYITNQYRKQPFLFAAINSPELQSKACERLTVKA